MRQIGEGTVRLLLRILVDGEDAEAPESVTLPHKLVVRASTAPAPRS
jgi:DNA-binding LacI/PurR family transcriptional regulator